MRWVPLFSLSFLVLALLTTGFPLGLASVQVGSAQVTSLTAFDCHVDPRKPDNVDGRLVARATVQCTTDMAERRVVTELLQRRADGSFDVVPGSVTILLTPERLDDDVYPADGDTAICRQVSGTRKFRSRVRVEDGNGNSEQVSSNSEDFHKDCIDGDIGSEPVSPSEDEEVAFECADEVCAEQRLPSTDNFYNCNVWADSVRRSGNALKGRGGFNCYQPLAKRLVYLKICDNRRALPDFCFGNTSRFLKRAATWEETPLCLATPITAPPGTYVGSYTQVGSNPLPPRKGDPNPKDRHHNGASVNLGSDCGKSVFG